MYAFLWTPKRFAFNLINLIYLLYIYENNSKKNRNFCLNFPWKQLLFCISVSLVFASLFTNNRQNQSRKVENFKFSYKKHLLFIFRKWKTYENFVVLINWKIGFMFHDWFKSAPCQFFYNLFFKTGMKEEIYLLSKQLLYFIGH